MASSLGKHPRERPESHCASNLRTTFRKNLKELVRDHLHTCIVLSSCSDSDNSEFTAATNSSVGDYHQNVADCWVTNEERNYQSVGGTGEFDSGEESCVESSTVSRRHARILDRWAARQARDMITTIERQALEAELMALSGSQSVLMRASSFLQREPSPARSECSTIDVPNLRASSLVQMWRELEAEARLPLVNRNNSGSLGGVNRINRTVSNNDNDSLQDEPSGNSEVREQDERYWATDNSQNGETIAITEDVFGDWESDIAPPSERNSSQEPASDIGEGERIRVADIIRRLTSENQNQSANAFWDDEIDRERVRGLSIQWGSGRFDLDNAQRVRNESQDGSVSSYDQGENSRLPNNGNLPRIRGRQATIDLLMRMKHQRQMELSRLVERQSVSQFSHRNHIQSLLRFRLLQNDVSAQDWRRATSTAFDVDHLHHRTRIAHLRERFSPQVRQNANVVSSNFHTQGPNNSPNLEYADISNQPSGLNSNYGEVALISQRNASLVPSLPSATNEEVLEEEEEADESLDRARQERTTNNANLHEWEDETLDVTEEPQINPQRHDVHADRFWLTTSSQPNQRNWEIQRQAIDSNSDTIELRELLDRRSVSNILASDFRERMDQLISSYLQRQEQQAIDESLEEEMEEQEQHDLAADTRQLGYTSVQLPLPSRSFIHHSPQHSQELEIIYDLRGEMTRLHHEMSELQKAIKSCMVMQVELQHSIKQEVSAALSQSNSGGPGERVECSKWVSMRKGSCCICYEMQVDSLLYRCGHMCTCFKCAHELHWSSGRCPICRAPIMDVVRVYSDS